MLLHHLVEWKGAILLGVFCFFFLAERAFPADPRPGHRSLGRLGGNLLLILLTVGLSLAWVLPLSAWLAAHQLWVRPSWLDGWLDGWPGLVATLIILDFWIYWWHRANHVVPFLWRFHQVHHRDETLDTTTALRFHFGEILLSSLVRVPVLLLLAVPFEQLVLFETLVLSAALFHHSDLRLPRGVEAALSKVIITPGLHWVHHHAVRVDTDSTYGTIFSFWDRLFCSRAVGTRRPAMPLGVEGRKEASLPALLVIPFRRPN